MSTRPFNTLEQRVASLERRYQSLYQRAYARNVRRLESFKRRTILVEQASRRMQQHNGMMRRLGHVFGSIKKGNSLMTFTPQERNYLEFLMRRRLDPVKFHRELNMECSYCGYKWSRRVDHPRMCPKCHKRFKEIING